VLERLQQTEPKLGREDDEPSLEEDEERAERKERPHTRIQAKLLRLWRDMGLDTWVARNDRSATSDGTRLSDLATVDQLPVGLPDAVRRTIELINVIWLRRNEYVAAFEVEKSTLIYTGLLRIADLVTLLPGSSWLPKSGEERSSRR
jgi:type II restriction enzyme